MKINFLKISFLILFFSISPSSPIQAANSFDVVINEVAWMGTTASSADEWIELLNTTSEAFSLDGWGLFEAGGGTKIITLSGTIVPGGFYLIERTDNTTVSDILADTFGPFGGSGLNNAGEYLVLKDALGNVVDEVNASSGWFAGSVSPDYFSMERKNPLISGSNPTNWASNNGITKIGLDANGAPINGTPKAQNSIIVSQPQPEPQPTCQPAQEICDGIDNDCDGQIDEESVCTVPEPQPTQEPNPTPPTSQTYPAGIFINELLPSPGGPDSEEEFIEFFNNNPLSVNISGWQISDTQGSTKTYTFPSGSNISGNGFLVIFRPTSKIILSNEGEGLVLKNPAGSIAHSISFSEEAPEGQSFARKTDGGWQWTLNLTPGQKNSFAVLKETVQEPKTESGSGTPAETSGESQGLPQSESQEAQLSQETSGSQLHSSGIFLNEILPSPAGPDEDEEWTELFNSNDFEVNLSGWQIKDTKGKIKTYTIPQNTKISPKGFLLLSRPTTKIALNNDEDGLILTNSAEEIVSQVSFEKAPTGSSYNQTSSGWVWSENLTPGAENIISSQLAEEMETEEKAGIQEKGLAAIGGLFPKFSRGLLVLFAALAIAIASGVIIFTLKKKIKTE